MIPHSKIFGRLGNNLFQGAYIYSQMKKGLIPDIFIQDFSYFEEYKDEIFKLYGEGIGYLPYVSIHVRRGDYVGNPFYCQLWETGYYIDAINLFPNRKFLVFSDDIEFCKIYFEGDKFAFDDSDNEIDAFNKLASCDSHIIANSSFSMFGAWLSPHPAKKIVAPSYDLWYSDKNKTRTIIPNTWKQII